MGKDLKNKVVVITGGAQGIGLAIAVKFLTESAKVIILDFNEAKEKESAKKLAAEFGDSQVAFFKCDVTKDLEEVSSKIIEDYKQVDVLVNNAGIINEFNLQATIQINTIAVIEWTLKFREHMRIDKGGKGGTIINIASVYGYMVDAFLPFYKASKHAVMGFTKTIGHESNYNKTGVRIVAVCPGYTHSELTENMVLDNKTVPAEYAKDFEEYAKARPWQGTEAVGKAAVEVFYKAESGTAWAIIGGQPIEKVPFIFN